MQQPGTACEGFRCSYMLLVAASWQHRSPHGLVREFYPSILGGRECARVQQPGTACEGLRCSYAGFRACGGKLAALVREVGHACMASRLSAASNASMQVPFDQLFVWSTLRV